MNTPTNLKYSKDHEWVRMEGEFAYVGITDFAQSELGEIVFIEVETVGETMEAGEIFGSVEAVKTVSDLLLPVLCEIVEFKEKLEEEPELVNNDPYGEGWMVKITVSNPSDLDSLLTPEEYSALLG